MSTARAGTYKKRSAAAYRWCFTVNNWTEEEYGLITSIPRSSVKYLILGKEVGESGTPHLQGFVNFVKKRRLGEVKKLPGFTRAHVEVARGTDLENQRYCQKGSQYLEIGCPSRQGKSCKLTEAVKVLQESKGDLKKVATEYPEVYIRHGRGMKDYVNAAGLVEPRTWKTEVTVVVGPPGVGKTRYVNEQTLGEEVYWKPRGPWWDGYFGQSVVVFDDFYGWVTFDELLRVCDRYPLKVPVKGAFVEFVAKKLFITSNESPENWYNQENIRGDIRALFRRVNVFLVAAEGSIKAGSPLHEINY
ncbi:putative replication-association protein [Mongoose-associated circovirus]|uniref:Replication-associated protein n=1 Tax=Mongoose-associated circovirus Mon-1 TaxID=3070927 RepID=A0AA48XTF0_9CIRC|nr:putative replication-association protein [Mongoose-associated circovirus]UBR88846.1 putative replication-association protein [Mongoose-associated circovirus Mon-1]